MKLTVLDSFQGDLDSLKEKVLNFRQKYPNETQFLITSEDGKNYLMGAGTEAEPEKFTVCNEYFCDTEVANLVNRYPEYYRWRILCIRPKVTYSIHHDGWRDGYRNVRLHIPIVTNPDSYLVFYDRPMEKAQGDVPYAGQQTIKYYQPKPGFVYEADTTDYHTAVNYHGTDERIHIVAERFIPNE